MNTNTTMDGKIAWAARSFQATDWISQDTTRLRLTKQINSPTTLTYFIITEKKWQTFEKVAKIEYNSKNQLRMKLNEALGWISNWLRLSKLASIFKDCVLYSLYFPFHFTNRFVRPRKKKTRFNTYVWH